MLVLKLSLVPFFLLIISKSGAWWGPGIAGWLAGLPVVAGPILYLLVVMHGPEFGVRAATLSLSAILASEAFNFAYAWSCRSWRWPGALAVALLAWLVCATVLACMPVSPAWALGAALIGVTFGQTLLPRARARTTGTTLTHRDLVSRMAAGALLTLLVTAWSARVGAGWSGILAVFPLLGSILSVSSHRAHGAEFVISMLRGMVLGRFSFAAFCLCLVFALPHYGTVAFLLASVAAVIVQCVTRHLALTPVSTATQAE